LYGNIRKIIIGINLGIDIAAIIFIFLLRRYNQVLCAIQSKYTNKLMQSFYIVGEHDFFKYFVGGLIFAALLIILSVKDYKSRDEIGSGLALILIFINAFLLITLIIVYANPIFTSMVVVFTCVGVGSSGKQ